MTVSLKIMILARFWRFLTFSDKFNSFELEGCVGKTKKAYASEKKTMINERIIKIDWSSRQNENRTKKEHLFQSLQVLCPVWTVSFLESVV